MRRQATLGSLDQLRGDHDLDQCLRVGVGGCQELVGEALGPKLKAHHRADHLGLGLALSDCHELGHAAPRKIVVGGRPTRQRVVGQHVGGRSRARRMGNDVRLEKRVEVLVVQDLIQGLSLESLYKTAVKTG